MGLFGGGNKHQKRGQPGNAGQFAPDTRGAAAPTTGRPTSGNKDNDVSLGLLPPHPQPDATDTTHQQYLTFNQLLEQKSQRDAHTRREEEQRHAITAVDRYLDTSARFGGAEGELSDIKRLPDGSHAALIYMVVPDNPREYEPTSRTVFYDLDLPHSGGDSIIPDEAGTEIPFDRNFPTAVTEKYGPGTLIANVAYNDRDELTVAAPVAPGNDIPRASNTHPGSLIILPGALVREHGADWAQRIAQNEVTTYQSYRIHEWIDDRQYR